MKKEDFKLRKLKINGGVVTVEYEERIENSGMIQDVQISERRLTAPHPDLTRRFQMLNVFVARSMYLDALDVIRGFIESSEQKKDVKLILAQMQEHQSRILDSIDVRGISVSGENEKIGIVISSVLSVKGLATAINTPRIALSRSTFGFEQGLSESIDELTDEVIGYLFDGKQAQVTMNFEEPEEEK